MKKAVNFIFLLLIVSATVQCFGANFYVRKGATGANDGSSWTSAWNEMSSIKFTSVACGDTIWIAGGTYGTTMTAVKNCASGAALNIKRVLATDSVPAAAAGWSSAYASQVVLQNWSGSAGIRLNGINNVIIDGRAGNPSKGIAYGISLQCTLSSCDGIDDGAGNNNYTIQNVELFGPPCVLSQSCTGTGASGINLPYGGTGMVYNNVYVHQWGEALRADNWSNATIENSFIGPTHNDNIQHEDILFSYDMTNFTFRYNKVWSSPNDGMFFYGNETNTQMYGNVIYHSGGALITFFSGFTHNVYVYNNDFENDGTFGDYQPGWLYFQGTMTGDIANNVWENITQSGNCPICNHNAYSTGAPSGETGSFTYAAKGQFVNESSGNPAVADFHLTAAGATAFANKGKALSAPFNLDPDGNVRGADGGWDIGAYEYTSSSTAVPSAPTALTGVVK